MELPDPTASLLSTLGRAQASDVPFRHWRLEAVLPSDVPAAIAVLPFAPPVIADTKGKRETNNSTRIFFSAENRNRFPVCESVAAAFQSGPVVARLEGLCAIRLAGSYLRIEYCQDTDGFWLEPHTDIGAKLFTMLVYLARPGDPEAWGTDLMTPDGGVALRAPYRGNAGLIFVPGADSWHGFARRPIAGVRRSLIVNYVKPEWRSRPELAYPAQAVG